MLQQGIICSVEPMKAITIAKAATEQRIPRYSSNFRRLRSKLKIRLLPIPSVDQIFNEFRYNSVLLTLDSFKIHNQVQMYESCEEQEDLRMQVRNPQFEVKPFRMKSWGASVGIIRDNILANIGNIKFYADYVVVYSCGESVA